MIELLGLSTQVVVSAFAGAFLFVAVIAAFRAFRNWMIHRRRAIFRFWNGRSIVGVDPIEVWRRLKADPNYDDETHLALVDAGDTDAIRITAEAVRRAFDTSAFNGQFGSGLTELECVALLWQFMEFVARLKKSTEPSPSSPGATESGSFPRLYGASETVSEKVSKAPETASPPTPPANQARDVVAPGVASGEPCEPDSAAESVASSVDSSMDSLVELSVGSLGGRESHTKSLSGCGPTPNVSNPGGLAS